MTSGRSAGIIALLFIVANAAFLLWVPLFPFIDLPNHLAESVIFKYHDHPGNLFSHYYETVPWYFPNTFHAIFCSLFPSVEFGNRVFHILYVVLLQGSVFLVIRRLRGNAWYGLLAILFTYNYNVTYGFVGFAISIPMLIVLFYFALLDIERPRWILKVLMATILLLIYFMHAQNALLGLLIYGAIIIYHHKTAVKKILRDGLIVAMPVVAIMCLWWLTRASEEEGSTLDFLLDYYPAGYLQTLGMRLRIVVFDNFQLRDGIAGVSVAAFFYGCVILPLLLSKPWRSPGFRNVLSKSFYSFLFFAITFLCYGFLPDQLPGQTPLFQRFCTIVMLSWIIHTSTWMTERRSRLLGYFVVIVCVAYNVMWFEYMYAFNQENRGFNRAFFEGVPNRATMAGLIYDNDFRGRKVYIHFPNYFIVWNRGIAATKIIDYRFGIVRSTPGIHLLPFYHELIGEHYRQQPQYSTMDYLLIRGDAPVARDANIEGFSLFRQSAVWKLYRRNK